MPISVRRRTGTIIIPENRENSLARQETFEDEKKEVRRNGRRLGKNILGPSRY
jgi:hypothetical protein